MKNLLKKLENMVILIFILGVVVAATGVFIQERTKIYQILIAGAVIAALGYVALGILYLTRRSWL